MYQEKDRMLAKELVRQMSKEEKRKYLWDYYRIPALIAVVLLAVAISIAVGMYNNVRAKQDLHVGVFGASADYEQTIERLAQEAGWDKGLSFVTGMTVNSGREDETLQVTVLLAADELDVVVCDRATADFIVEEAEIPARIYPVEETALAPNARSGKETLVLILEGTGRPEKTQEFAALLGCK